MCSVSHRSELINTLFHLAHVHRFRFRLLQDEKVNLFKCTSSIMHFGNSQWKQRPREEQAEAEGTEDCEKVAHLLGVEAADLIKGLLKPRIKVNTDSFG